MDLRTFIKETLCQISDGMIEAQEALKDKGVRINPPYSIDSGNFTENNEATRNFQSVDFDIAVTIAEENEGAVKGGLKIFAMTIGGEKSKSSSAEAVSRIKFSIVALLPQDVRQPAKAVEVKQRSML